PAPRAAASNPPGPGSSATGRVVVAVDPQRPAPQVVGFARDTAGLRGVELRIVAVEHEPTEHTQRVLQRLTRPATDRGPGPEAERGPAPPRTVAEVRLGTAAEELVRAAGEGCDLFVVGRSGRSLGPVARAVAGRVRVPVAVVPHG
ncbi:universal stress protein, partial [Kitasatospora sp. NPDC085879]|uniref:universal stress protein n=1 Tax=Kitasatospora sp. NPDC085879 TaxID=3154769 RepID=UPI0034261D66